MHSECRHAGIEMFVGMRQSLGHALDSKKRDAEAAVSAWTEMVRCGHLSVQGFVGPRACPDMKFRGGSFRPVQWGIFSRN
jgi:hypothetical protein